MNNRWNFYKCAGFITACAVFYFHTPTNSDEWASWFQAIGSVAAISISIYIVNRQRIAHENNQFAAELRQEITLLKIIKAIWSDIARDAEQIKTHLGNIQAPKVDLSVLKTCQERLGTATVFDIPDSEAASASITALVFLNALIKDIEDANARVQTVNSYGTARQVIPNIERPMWARSMDQASINCDQLKIEANKIVDRCSTLVTARMGDLRSIDSAPWKAHNHYLSSTKNEQ